MDVAFYGTGEPARPYLTALARRPDATLVAACDLDRRAAEQAAAGWGARVYLSYEAMLQEVRPDALWVCVEPHLQGDVILKAAELTVPFFVAPPGAVDYERACHYGRAVARSRLVTAVGFPTRYTDVAHEAREYLGANPVPLALAWWLRRPAGDPGRTAAGLLWAEACRLVDALRFFCGEVDRVRALRAGESALVVQLECATGTVGVLTCTTFARPEPRVELELLGEGWSLHFGDHLSTLRVAEPDKTTTLRCLNDPAADHAAAFLDAVAASEPDAVGGGYADALRTMAVCRAVVISAQEGRSVEVPSPAGEPGG
jgi:predicted dehydrogenase